MCSLSLDIVPPSPVQVESIKLLQDLPLPIEITDDNRRVLERFDLSWALPMEPYGEIQQYVVFVGSSLKQDSDKLGFQYATVRFFAFSQLCTTMSILCSVYIEWQ